MALSLINPYCDLIGGQWLRGNLHAHTRHSDGRRDRQTVIGDYAARGYGFLMTSDHDVCTSTVDYATYDAKGMLLIPGNEITSSGQHLLHVNAQRLLQPISQHQVVIDAATTDRSFIIVNHPNWERDFNHCPIYLLRQWTEYLGLEIFNGILATNDVDVFERACLIGQVNRRAGMDLVTDRYTPLQPLGLGIKFRAHPLGIGIASVQLQKLDQLNARRRRYVETVEQAIASIDGLEPIATHHGAQRAGFYTFCFLYDAPRMGLAKDQFVDALRQEGLSAQDGPYPLLHRLPLFAEGLDIFGRGRGPLCTAAMGGDYPGYKAGDLPISEEAWGKPISLPVLSNPVDGAAEKVVAVIRKVARRARQLPEAT